MNESLTFAITVFVIPEFVTAITAVRIGALTLAVSNIVGGNAFDAIIIAFADFAYVAGSIYADSGFVYWLVS